MVIRAAALALILAISCAPAQSRRPGGPAIDLSEEIWDFGTIARGQTREHAVTLTNLGGDTLSISLHSTCACLESWADSDNIPPGGRSTVRVAYTGEDIRERVTKTLFIDSNGTTNPRLTLTVTGEVLQGDVPHIAVRPDPLLVEATEHSTAAPYLVVGNRGRQDLVVDEVRCFGCLTDWVEQRLKEGEEARLSIELLRDWHDQRWIEIDSNDPLFPVKKVPIVEL